MKTIDLKKAFELAERKIEYLREDNIKGLLNDPEIQNCLLGCPFCELHRHEHCYNCEIREACDAYGENEPIDVVAKLINKAKRKHGLGKSRWKVIRRRLKENR